MVVKELLLRVAAGYGMYIKGSFSRYRRYNAFRSKMQEAADYLNLLGLLQKSDLRNKKNDGSYK
jgi:hypothetical protein